MTSISSDMNQTTMENTTPNEIRENWGWLLFMGISLVVLGTIGLYMAGVMTLATVYYLGFMVIAAGVLILVDAFKAQGWKAILWEILIAVAYILSGVVMVFNPGATAVWFTLFIAAFLFSSGIFRIVLGFKIRKETRGWGWTVAGGIASIILGIIVFLGWPVSGLWVIGLFVSIEMIVQGVSMSMIAMAAKG